MILPASGSIWTIVVAAGTGSRFGGPIPKQFVVVAGRRVLDWSVQAAAATSDGVVIVLPSTGEFAEVSPDTPTDLNTEIRIVSGGATRSESVRCGLACVPDDAAVVLVHDAARPLASRDLFMRVAAAVIDGAAGVVPVVPVVDTLRHVEGHPVDRADLVAVQTPQGFSRAALAQAHAEDQVATDDATLVTLAGGQVVTVAGERWNLKVTDPTDELIIAALLERRR